MYGLIFDMDGVLTETSKFHLLAWQKIAEELGGIFPDSHEEKIKGVSRMDSLEIVLEICGLKGLSKEEKNELAKKKNKDYLEMVESISEEDVLPGMKSFIEREKKKGAKIALGSSSKSGAMILKKLGLDSLFDVIVDGNTVITAKPDPEVFLKASALIKIPPERCIVIEDAAAGVEAAKAAGMKCIAIGNSKVLEKADIIIRSSEEIKKIDSNNLLE